MPIVAKCCSVCVLRFVFSLLGSRQANTCRPTVSVPPNKLMYLSKLPLGYIIRRCSFLLLLEPLVEANTNQSLESLQGKAPPQAMSPDSPATAARFMRLGLSPAKTGTAKALPHLKKDIASFKASLPKSPPRGVSPLGGNRTVLVGSRRAA